MRSRLCPSRGPERPVQEMRTALKNPEDSTWTLKSWWPWTHMPSRQRGAERLPLVSVLDGRPDKDASQAPVTALLVAGRLLRCPVSVRRGERKSGREAGSVSQRSAESFLLPGCWAPSALRWLTGFTSIQDPQIGAQLPQGPQRWMGFPEPVSTATFTHGLSPGRLCVRNRLQQRSRASPPCPSRFSPATRGKRLRPTQGWSVFAALLWTGRPSTCRTKGSSKHSGPCWESRCP